jgi:hypothetical protein
MEWIERLLFYTIIGAKAKDAVATVCVVQVAYRQGHFKVKVRLLRYRCQSLLGIINGPGLADDCNLDLARILQAFLHCLGDIFGQLD